MSRDVETLLRDATRSAPPSPGLAAPSDLRRRGDRRRAVRRGGTAVVAVALVGGIAVGLSGLSGTSSAPPVGPGAVDPSASVALPDFPVPPTVDGTSPAVSRQTGTGPYGISANLDGTTTTYVTCLGGGPFRLTVEGVPGGSGGAPWISGTCSGTVDAATMTLRTGAENAVIRITVDTGALWAIQVVPGSASVPGVSQEPLLPVPSPASATPTVVARRPCTGSDLQVTETGGDGAAGSVQAVLVFRNVSTTACSLHGYPTVTADDTAQRLARRATHSLNALFGGSAVVATVSIAPGQAASATLQWGDNPAGNATTCLAHPVLAVTPPGTTTVTRLETPGFTSICIGPQVLPVVAGPRGTVVAP